mgnify:CR=1 FL=1
MTNTNANNILQALALKYQAQRAEAMTNLNIYLNNPAGIGEHPGVVEECAKLIDAISTAQGSIDQISDILSRMTTNEEENTKENNR